MIVVKIQSVDHDDFPMGNPRKIYGPFDSYEHAQEWSRRVFAYNAQTDRFKGLIGRERAIVSSIDILPPD